MKKVLRKMGVVLMIMTMFFNYSSTVVMASQMEVPYFIINGEEIVYYGVDFENSETGEYFYWSKERGVDKSFSFKVRSSVTSSKFTVNGSKVTVKSSANIVDEGYYNQTGKTYDGDGFPYTVSLTGIFTRTLNFEVDGTEKGTISGLVDGGTYSVTIATGKELPAYLYLKGSGTVTS